ncbi:GDP-mannose mannosyl hydrolase [Cupriavidus sp. AU9028]|uniref:GDP-mannose mannosyl hydrolase n=1 Tax=Cupriavidus sp. AU9028 TaxID=2871157 RepID=UPI001C94161F|nr:GDP-mannose mannosyl hydrolase [Cupriavidus sp. AU9028]MBY4895516.1 GDP-mannose mannosyl hydrolase [Cupriavidus sp. AU9028]
MIQALPVETFRTVVASTPLVSIDLLIRDAGGRYLLGQRVNPPAQGSWFVPGGRIRKNETLEAAIARLQREELGTQAGLAEAGFAGVYEHFYADNFAGEQGSSTHYVVLAWRFDLRVALPPLPQGQHDRYRWALPEEILLDETVHRYTRDYFNDRGGDYSGGSGAGAVR